MKTITYRVNSDVAEIIAYGYTDAIEDPEKHQALCNKIDREILPAGYYWCGKIEHTENFEVCEVTGLFSEIWVATAIKGDV